MTAQESVAVNGEKWKHVQGSNAQQVQSAKLNRSAEHSTTWHGNSRLGLFLGGLVLHMT